MGMKRGRNSKVKALAMGLAADMKRTDPHGDEDRTSILDAVIDAIDAGGDTDGHARMLGKLTPAGFLRLMARVLRLNGIGEVEHGADRHLMLTRCRHLMVIADAYADDYEAVMAKMKAEADKEKVKHDKVLAVVSDTASDIANALFVLSTYLPYDIKQDLKAIIDQGKRDLDEDDEEWPYDDE